MADLSTGNYAAISILAALRHAERTGEGQHIDISLLDTQIAMMANQGSNYLVGGIVPGRLGNRHPTVVPYTTFAVADGVLIIAIGNDLQFRAFCSEMGVPELGSDPRFALARDRLNNRDAIEAIVADLVKAETRDALIARLEAAGVPVGPVNTLEDVFNDPFIEARGTVHTFVREDGVEIPSVAYPGKLSRTPTTFGRRPPRVGEHSRELLADWLGMDEAEFAGLVEAGAVKGG
jgi:crotonobetainyl-CoA:carnitine CoA-transferase CaiB-like acyl-CoA transferase